MVILKRHLRQCHRQCLCLRLSAHSGVAKVHTLAHPGPSASPVRARRHTVLRLATESLCHPIRGRQQPRHTALSRRVGAKVTTLICLALTTAGQLALGTTSSVIAVAAVLATSSMAFAIWNVQARSTIQRAVPADLLGRVVSINRVVIAAGSLVVPHLVALPPAASDFMPRSFSATRF